MNTKAFSTTKTNVMLGLLTLAAVARATIPEPDNILYGNIVLDNVVVTAARTDVVVEARRLPGSPAIASYRMGANPALGNFYSLRLLLESIPPLANTNAAQIGDGLVLVLSDAAGFRAQMNLTINDRGQVQRVDFGGTITDSDGDDLPDLWELQRFGNLAQTGASPAANGQSAHQNFVAGIDPTDPNAAFWLNIARSNNLNHVSFMGRRAEGPGYEGMTRLYSLESQPTLAPGSWSDVPSFVNLPGDNQTILYQSPSSGPAAFFRGKVALHFGTLATDSDLDGLPDAWETLHFGDLSKNPGAAAANGLTVLQHFVAGSNPGQNTNAFRLNIAVANNQRLISFEARRAEGVGYEGRQRFYTLETSASATGPWTNVTTASGVLGNNQTLMHQASTPATAGFFRGRVWLQP